MAMAPGTAARRADQGLDQQSHRTTGLRALRALHRQQRGHKLIPHRGTTLGQGPPALPQDTQPFAWSLLEAPLPLQEMGSGKEAKDTWVPPPRAAWPWPQPHPSPLALWLFTQPRSCGAAPTPNQEAEKFRGRGLKAPPSPALGAHSTLPSSGMPLDKNTHRRCHQASLPVGLRAVQAGGGPGKGRGGAGLLKPRAKRPS